MGWKEQLRGWTARPTISNKLISTLDKRVFLLHNVHEDQPVLFHTRWAMNYLTGPLTRVQLPALNQLVGAKAQKGEPKSQPSHRPSSTSSSRVTSPKGSSSTRPNVPAGIDEYYLPNTLSFLKAVDAAGLAPPQDEKFSILYKPALIAQATVRFLKRNYNLDYDLVTTALVKETGRQSRIHWDDWISDPIDLDGLEPGARSGARFQELTSPLTDGSRIRELETDFKDWIYHTVTVPVRANEDLEVYAGPEVSQGEFRRLCASAAEKAHDDERKKVNKSFDKKLDTIKDRLLREKRELQEDEVELSQRKIEEVGTHAENLISLLIGRQRRMTTSLTKHRMTSQAKADVEESLDAIEEYKKEIAHLERERQEATREVDEKWQEILEGNTEIPITPYKKNILLEIFGVAWFPYYLYDDGGRDIELAAYKG